MAQIGKYQLVNKLATGGMAEVFLAKAAGPGGFEKKLVVKRILPHLAEDVRFVEMFLGEARLAAQLNHPNVVQIFDFGEAEGAYYLAMEFIDGPNLRVLVKRAQKAGLELPPVLCARMVSAACEGLAFAHDFVDPSTGEPLNLIHRDISPDNILLSRQGAVKVVDFGIAKAANQEHRTQTGQVKGKIAYMPPEQVRAEALDRRADVYALGVVLYELLTGQRPYSAGTDVGLMQAILFEPYMPLTERRPGLPPALVQIVDRALARSKEERYPDCRALQQDLERYILSTGEPVGPWHLAQLVAQVLGEGGPPAPTPPASSGPRPVRESTPTPVARTGQRDEEQRPPAPREPPAPTAAEVLLQPPAAPPARRRTLLPVLLGFAVVMVPGAALLLRTMASPSPVPEPPPQLQQPTQAQPIQAQPTQAQPTQAPPTQVQPTQAPPPAFAQPAEAQPAEAQPAEVQPAEVAQPAQGEPAPAAGEDTATPEPVQVADVISAPVEIPTSPVQPASRKQPTSSRSTPRTKATRVARAEETAPAPQPVAAQAPPPQPQEQGEGTLEFRIRPYAVVSLDGKSLGQTPIAPLTLPAGEYRIQLVNEKLGKNVTRTFTVKAGQVNVFKANLNDE